MYNLTPDPTSIEPTLNGAEWKRSGRTIQRVRFCTGKWSAATSPLAEIATISSR